MSEGLNLVVNGRQVLTRVAPRLVGGALLLPLRAAVESCGGTVEFLAGPPPQAVAVLDRARLKVTLGETQARTDTRPLLLPAAPVLVEETLLVPAEALRALGESVELDELAQAVLCGCADLRLAGRRVFLDPGHGGADPGALGPAGAREADVTLAVAAETARLLVLAGAQPSLSRTSDRTVALAVRVRLAQSRQAELFLSIHCNSFSDPAAHGSETYYYEAWEGHKLAAAVQQELVGELGLTDRGVKEAGFYVLRHSLRPACLTELGFLSNAAEAALLADPRVQLRAALALFRGVRAVLDRTPALLG